jgi:hypothetical protein
MTHVLVPEHHVTLCTSTLGAGSCGAFVEVVSALGSVDWLLEVSAYLGTTEYTQVQQMVQHLLSQLELHERALQVPRYHTAPVLGRVLESVRNNAFLQHCRACYDAHNRRTAMAVQRPSSSLANSISPLSLDGALFCISEGSSMPGTPAIMTGSSSPASISGAVPITLTGRGQSMGVAALTEAITGAGDDAEFAAVLKKLSRFQAVPQDTVPAGVKDTSPAAVGTTAGIAERLVSTASPNVAAAGTESPQQSSPPPPKAGGFNFASLSRPAKAPSTATSTVSANPVIGAPSALDAFDVPAMRPAQRTTTPPAPSSGGFNFATAPRPSRPQSSASDILATGTVDPTSAVPSALDALEAPPVRPTQRVGNPSAQRGGTVDRRSRGGASLDLLGDATDMFPPPARPSRPATTASTATATCTGTHSVDSVGAADRGRGGASLDLLGDATDLYPPPVRPSRPATTTASATSSSTQSVDNAAAVGSRDRGRGGASLDLLGDATDMFPPPVRPSRPSTTTASATSAGTQSVDNAAAVSRRDRGRGGASLDLLGDATDMFPPPVRPSRPTTTTAAATASAASKDNNSAPSGNEGTTE